MNKLFIKHLPEYGQRLNPLFTLVPVDKTKAPVAKDRRIGEFISFTA